MAKRFFMCVDESRDCVRQALQTSVRRGWPGIRVAPTGRRSADGHSLYLVTAAHFHAFHRWLERLNLDCPIRCAHTVEEHNR